MRRKYYINSLCHYGVPGMHWGERRWQYKDGSLTPEGRIHYGYGEGRTNKTLRSLVNSGDVKLSNIPKYTQGLGLMAGPDGVLHITADTSEHDWNWVPTSGDNVPTALRLKKKDYSNYTDGRTRDYSIYNSVLEDSNPSVGRPGTTNNCTMNTAFLELAQAGYKIDGQVKMHAGYSNTGENSDCFSWWFDGAKHYQSDYQSAQDAIESFGPKTSGAIGIRYPDGNGHSMHWTVNEDGVFEIQDGQVNRRFNSVEEMCDAYGADKDAGLNIYRLDCATPNLENMAADGVIRGDDQYDSYTDYGNRLTNRNSGKVVGRW